MTDRKWRLGEDMFPEDNILDGIIFDDLILAVHCNCRHITREAVRRLYNAIIEQRLQDAAFLLENNMDEIVMRAREGRES